MSIPKLNYYRIFMDPANYCWAICRFNRSNVRCFTRNTASISARDCSVATCPWVQKQLAVHSSKSTYPRYTPWSLMAH